MRSRETQRWCRECWVGWFQDKFRKTLPQKVVTLHVSIDSRLEDSLAVTCTGLDGSEVLRTAGADVNALHVGDVRQKLRCELGSGEERRLLPDGWFYSQRELEAWASCHEGGILPLRPRERAEGMKDESSRQQDDRIIDVLDRSEAHWQSVWAAAPKFIEQIHLCTSDGVFLAKEDDGLLLSMLSDRSRAMKSAP